MFRKHYIATFIALSTVMSSSYASTPLKGCYTHWLPYSYKDESGQATGFSIDIYKEALKRADLEITFEELPWTRCKRSLEHGRVDFVVDGGVQINNSIISDIRTIPWVLVLWVNKANKNERFTTFEALKNSEVGYVQNYGNPKGFLNNQSLELSPVMNDLEGLRMLHHERFKYFYGDLVNSQHLKIKHELSITPILPAINIEYLDLTFHSSLKSEQAKYTAALQTLYDDGTIKAAYKKYLGPSYQKILDIE